MIRDSEKGIGYLLGHEEPETKARRVAEIKRQIESSARPIRPLSEPIDAFSSLPLATVVNLGDSNFRARPKITPPVKTKKKTDAEMVRWAMGEIPEKIVKRPNKDNPLSLKFPYNKTTGRFEDQKGSKVDPRKAIKEQQFLDQRIEGAKTLQYIADHNTMYGDQPKAYWQWDGAKQDYVDVNEGKEKKPIHQQLTDLKNWDQKNREERLRKDNSTNNKRRSK